MSQPTDTTPKPVFSYYERVILKNGLACGRACSVTLARRIVNALNAYTPNRKGY